MQEISFWDFVYVGMRLNATQAETIYYADYVENSNITLVLL